MMSMFSIVVPVYNVQPFLDECIKSVLEQNCQDWELLLIDDGSTDGSLDICKRYADMDNRITFICGEHGGVGSARNLGINAAKGEYIVFLDSDDWIDPSYLETAFSVACTDDVSAFFTGLRRMPVNSSTSLPKPVRVSCRDVNEDSFTLLLTNNYISSVIGTILRRSAIADVRFDTTVTMGEDLRFVFDVLQNCTGALYVDSEARYNYRMREGSLTTIVNMQKLVSLEKTYARLYREGQHRDYTEGRYLEYISDRFFSDIYYLNQVVLQSEHGIQEKNALRLFLAQMNHMRKCGFAESARKTDTQLLRGLELDITVFDAKRWLRRSVGAIKRRLFRRSV